MEVDGRIDVLVRAELAGYWVCTFHLSPVGAVMTWVIS